MSGRTVRAIRATEIEPRRVRWIWQDRVPARMLSLLLGKRGLGKTHIGIECIARLTRGELDGTFEGQPVNCTILTFEDADSETIVPRLLAADADLDRVDLLVAERDGSEDLVSLPHDVDEVAASMRQSNSRLLFVDPLIAALSGDLDSHRDQSVRRALAPLKTLAEGCEAAVLGVVHPKKGEEPDVLNTISGSAGFGNAARSVLAFGQPPGADKRDPGRVLAHAKCNVAPLAGSLAYRMEPREVATDDGPLGSSVVVPCGESSVEAEELFAKPQRSRAAPDREAAKKFLRTELRDGPKPVKAIKAAAEAELITDATLRRAKDELGVTVSKDGYHGGFMWALPALDLSGLGRLSTERGDDS